MDLPRVMKVLTTAPRLHSKACPHIDFINLLASESPMSTAAPRFNGKNLAVVIAVPVAVVVFLLFLCGVCALTRKSRRLPDGLLIPRNGGRKRGYAEGRSRRKRAGLEKNAGEFE